MVMISRPMRLGQGVKLFAVGPVAAGAEDFDQHAGGLQSGHPGQIDGALGVPGPPQHAAFLRHQRIEVAGPDEIGRLAGRVENLLDRPGPLRRGHARAAAAMIDRHGEGGPQRGRVVLDDRRQVEPLGRLGQDGHAELPAAVGDHEVDDLGRDLLGRADEVALRSPGPRRP